MIVTCQCLPNTLNTYFLCIFSHLFWRGKEKHPRGLIELNLFICFLYTTCNLISTNKTQHIYMTKQSKAMVHLLYLV